MNKEQLSRALGGVDETILTAALDFAPQPRRARRGVWLAACLAAALSVSAAAAVLTGRWEVSLGAPKSADEILLEANWVAGGEELRQFAEAVDGCWQLVGSAALEAYPLPDEVCARIRADVADGKSLQPRLSLGTVEHSYGVRLLRGSDETVRDVQTLTGVYGEDLPVAGELFLNVGWVEQHDGWAARASARLSTAARSAEDPWGGVTFFKPDAQTIRACDVRSLGVTAQIAFSDGEHPGATAFFVKDDIAYAFDLFLQPGQPPFETAREMLETLHY